MPTALPVLTSFLHRPSTPPTAQPRLSLLQGRKTAPLYPDITQAPGWGSMRRHDRTAAERARSSILRPSAPPLEAFSAPRPVPRKRTTLPPAAAPVVIRNCRDCAKRDISGINPDGGPAYAAEVRVKHEAVIKEMKAYPMFMRYRDRHAHGGAYTAPPSHANAGWMHSDSFIYTAKPGH